MGMNAKNVNLHKQLRISQISFFEEIILLFAGGADSNVSMLYWMLLWLTNNPHVQDKMAQEIHENIGKLLNS